MRTHRKNVDVHPLRDVVRETILPLETNNALETPDQQDFQTIVKTQNNFGNIENHRGIEGKKTRTHGIGVGHAKQPMGEDGSDEDVDEERDEQRQASLDKVILVRLAHLVPPVSVHNPCLQ